jgi:hypothetical protein
MQFIVLSKDSNSNTPLDDASCEKGVYDEITMEEQEVPRIEARVRTIADRAVRVSSGVKILGQASLNISA